MCPVCKKLCLEKVVRQTVWTRYTRCSKVRPGNILLVNFMPYSQNSQCGLGFLEDAGRQRRQSVAMQPPVCGVNEGFNDFLKSLVQNGPCANHEASLLQRTKPDSQNLHAAGPMSPKKHSLRSSRVGIYGWPSSGLNGTPNTHSLSNVVKPSKTPTTMPSSLSEFAPRFLVIHRMAVVTAVAVRGGAVYG